MSGNWIVKWALSSLLVLNSILPANALDDSEAFLAIFGSPDLVTDFITHSPHKPDFSVSALSWDEFDDFLIEANKKADGKLLVLDIDVHGTIPGLLEIEYSVGKKGKGRIRSWSNMGMVFNHVESHITGRFLLLFEACYGDLCYYHRSMTPLHTPSFFTESYKGDPKYPVWGNSNTIGLNSLVHEEVYHNALFNTHDLRKCVVNTPGDDDTAHVILSDLLLNLRYLDYFNKYPLK